MNPLSYRAGRQGTFSSTVVTFRAKTTQLDHKVTLSHGALDRRDASLLKGRQLYRNQIQECTALESDFQITIFSNKFSKTNARFALRSVRTLYSDLDALKVILEHLNLQAVAK